MRTARSSGRPGGVSTRHPPGADPPQDQAPPGPGPPWDQAPPGTRNPPWEQTPLGPGTPSLDQAPPLLTESQMPVKTLPCPNFVAGGKYKYKNNNISMMNSFLAHVAITRVDTS